jgi:hypothetical protein
MNTKYLKFAGIAAFSLFSFAALAADSSSLPVTQLHYGATGVSDGQHGELNAAPAYGDLGHGPHGTFIKIQSIPTRKTTGASLSPAWPSMASRAPPMFSFRLDRTGSKKAARRT